MENGEQLECSGLQDATNTLENCVAVSYKVKRKLNFTIQLHTSGFTPKK